MKQLVRSAIRFWLGGPLIRNNSGVIESRNAANSAYAVHRVATPVAANDAATKDYADTAIDTDVAAALTDLTINDGADNTKEAFFELDGLTTATTRTITVPDKDITLAGTGDITTSLAAQLNLVESRIVTLAYTDTGDNNLGATIPAGANVLAAFVDVTTTFDGTTPVLKIGDAGTDDSVMATTDNDLTSSGPSAIKAQMTNFASETQLLANLTIGGSPSQGACDVVVLFSRAAS